MNYKTHWYGKEKGNATRGHWQSSHHGSVDIPAAGNSMARHHHPVWMPTGLQAAARKIYWRIDVPGCLIAILRDAVRLNIGARRSSGSCVLKQNWLVQIWLNIQVTLTRAGAGLFLERFFDHLPGDGGVEVKKYFLLTMRWYLQARWQLPAPHFLHIQNNIARSSGQGYAACSPSIHQDMGGSVPMGIQNGNFQPGRKQR